MIGDDCENSEECPSSAECVKDKCSCPEGYITAPGGKICLPANLGIIVLILCYCIVLYRLYNIIEIGETCTLNEQCGVEYSNCKENVCQCQDKYISINSMCLPGMLSNIIQC